MKKILFAFAILLHASLSAQGNPHYPDIYERFSSYSELPREVAYVHLNKSTYIKGEQLCYKAYVYDKDKKQPSQETKNLYCILVDEKGKIMKKHLIRIEQGVGSGIMEIDSLITSGKYRFRAYTNWMRNFSEPNYYEQEIQVLDPDAVKPDLDTAKSGTVDAQFLPEGGHAVAGLEVVYGAIVRDSRGFGIPFLEGVVTDEQEIFISNFKLNAMGIGRFGFPTQPGRRYFASFTHKEETYKIPLGVMESRGIALKLQDLEDQVGLIFNARFSDQSHLEVPYLITVHDGKNLKALDLNFEGKDRVVRLLPKKDLFKGMNIITLFNPQGKPILERLYFNQQNIPLKSVVAHEVKKQGDSLLIQLKVPGALAGQWNSMSVSALPSNTISYGGHHNLPSYHLLRPYIRGSVENAAYYFLDPSPKKAFELDNLLITQGWSSYDWNTVFNKPPNYLFDFEKGITYKVNINYKKGDQFYIFPTSNHTSQLLSMEEGRQDFSVDQFFPVEDEKLGIGEIKKGGMNPAKVFIQFKPTSIPEFNDLSYPLLGNKITTQNEAVNAAVISFDNVEKLQQLDEVLVIKDRTKTRLERLNERTFGSVDIFEDDDVRRNMTLSAYLSGQGFITRSTNGNFFIEARNPNSPNNATPMIYLDGTPLGDFSVLWQFRMDIVDYVEINRSGIGGGLMGGGGIIKIVTDPYRRMFGGASETSFTQYEIPLAFEAQKRFYNPIYSSTNSGFFLKYGTVDWQPDLRLETDGFVTIKVKDYGVSDIKLFLEGVVNNSEYVSGIIDLRLD
ncbi:hypothetical protein LVD13_12910 [Flavobacteriaceae bacterium D16]|nr:hypothetical protein [Flavobacteriaceae bacterium D16]